jgi:two-component system NtrC family sensor kinase
MLHARSSESEEMFAPASGSKRERPSTAVRMLVAVLVAVVLLPLLLFVWNGWNSYHRHYEEAADRLRNAVEIASEHAARVLDTHELIIEQINQLLDGLSDETIRREEAKLHDYLRLVTNSHQQVSAVFVFDAACRGLASSTVFPIPANVQCSDRDYFRAHQTGLVTPGESYVSALIAARLTGRNVIIISKRRGKKSASEPFAGITAVSIDPAYFQSFFSRIAAMGFTTIVLVRNDGSFLARYPGLPEDLSKLPANSAMMESIERQPQYGIFRSFSPVDQVWRLVAYRRLQNYPIYMTVGLDEAEVLSAWWAARMRDLLFGLPMTAALMVLTIFALWRTRRESIALLNLQQETERRRTAEEQLRQSQKMEAIGQLTGGIAHDFNNLLMVISGSVDRLRREPVPNKAIRSLDMIKTAAERGATLTRQLLSFSQQRTVQPRVFNLCHVLIDLKGMLERALRSDIELKVDIENAECFVFADRSELDLAFLNIAVNARDAMPNGGTLTASVSPVSLAGEPEIGGLNGEFVAISFADTGVGIAPSHLPRVFEPYFTTKGAGRGTGLGLSQVYGFAKQAGGHATIVSAPSRGTTITIYLPRADNAAKSADNDKAPNPTAVAQQKTVLLIDDNADVSEVVANMLLELGHEVCRAADSAEAFQKLKQRNDIDHVVSDMVLPGSLGGLELARALRKSHPEVPVLLITGYSDKAREGIRDGFVVLKKPFESAQLEAIVGRAANA